MKKIAIAVLFLGVLLPTTAVYAQPTQDVRCNTDSLNVPQALARLEWARRCGMQLLTPAAETSINVLGAANNPYPEWAESAGAVRHYAGSQHNYRLNQSYNRSRYADGLPNGWLGVTLSNGQYKFWLKHPDDADKLQPLYPAFGTNANGGLGAQLWPHPTNVNDCNLYSNAAGTGAPATAHWVTAYCVSSCYTPDQQVLFASEQTASGSAIGATPFGGQYTSIFDANARQIPRVMTLTKDSTLDKFALQPKDVFAYTIEFYDSDHEIFEIHTARGVLRVTSEHPILRGDGRMVFAEALQVEDELVRVDGTLDPIVKIVKANHFGKVYNLRPDSSDLVENILVAQGYLVGSAQYQNDYVNYINRVILSHTVPASVLPTFK
jgi:hypothetical protein